MLALFFMALLIIAPTVFIYFLLIKTMDRYEPEPWWLLTVMFFWGALGATFFAIIGNEVGQWGIGSALSLGEKDPLLSATTASFVAPLVEESTKGLGLLVLWALSALWLKKLDGPMDGAIYGGVVGLGFTLTEDVLYVSNAGAANGGVGFVALFVLRTVMAGLGHASFTAMTGLGIGIAVDTRSGFMKVFAPFSGWCAAVALHFLHNLLASFLLADGTGLILKLVLFWTFDLLFFVLLFILALRDRAIVLHGLIGEVGRLLHPKELQRTTSLWMLVPLANELALFSSTKGYFKARDKQLKLVQLAFLKRRRERGEQGRDIDGEERGLRQRVEQHNAAEVFIGAR